MTKIFFPDIVIVIGLGVNDKDFFPDIVIGLNVNAPLLIQVGLSV